MEENDVSISLVIITYNESACIRDCIRSALPVCGEVVVVDYGSTDGTPEVLRQIASRSIKPFRIYEMPPLHRFDICKTVASHLARGEWVFMLDADERLDTAGLYKLPMLAASVKYDAWRFPRKRWADLEMTQQVEIEAYPDWQTRLYQNNVNFRWERTLHEHLVGPKNVGEDLRNPCIHHHVDTFHLADPVRAAWRREQREKLAKLAGVDVEGTPEASRLAGFTT